MSKKIALTAGTIALLLSMSGCVVTSDLDTVVSESPSPAVAKDSLVGSEADSSNLSISQQNAAESAASYLRLMGFSKQGLVEQLAYEGFTEEDALLGIESLNIDWNAQAAKKAESYLSTMAFSADGLLEQLLFEGFTKSEAEFGVANSGLLDSSGASANGSTSVSQKNALSKAESYLAIMSFSRDGLVKQLEFDGFSEADATYAVDAVGADWNEQAAKKAKDYLDLMAFSHSGLVDQLVFDGFTPSQAEYGVKKAGL